MYVSQLADLDNKLRQGRTGSGVQSSWKPRQLSELDKLPKPWHTEYWTDNTLLEGSSLPFTLRSLTSSKTDPLLDGKVGALQPPPSLPQLPKSVESRKQEEKSSLSPKFSFDQMVMAREKALSCEDKNPAPVEPKKPGFKYSGSSTQMSKVAALQSTPVVCKKQEVVVGNKLRSRSSSVESSSWEYYTETEPEDSD